MKTSPLHGEFDQLLLASSEGCGLHLLAHHTCEKKNKNSPNKLTTCEKIKVVPIILLISLLVKKKIIKIVILLISLLVKKKIIKIVPIIPPPGPRCRSFGDPFGSEHCGHYRRHTSRDGGYSSEILGGH